MSNIFDPPLGKPPINPDGFDLLRRGFMKLEDLSLEEKRERLEYLEANTIWEIKRIVNAVSKTANKVRIMKVRSVLWMYKAERESLTGRRIINKKHKERRWCKCSLCNF